MKKKVIPGIISIAAIIAIAIGIIIASQKPALIGAIEGRYRVRYMPG